LFSLKEEGLLFASFLMSKNITKWDLVFLVYILSESNAASRRRRYDGSGGGGHGFGGR
jgi:hypothetical protein